MADITNDLQALEASSHDHNHHEHGGDHHNCGHEHSHNHSPPPPPPNHHSMHDNSPHIINFHHNHAAQQHPFADENLNFSATDLFTNQNIQQQQQQAQQLNVSGMDPKEDSWENNAVTQIVTSLGAEMSLASSREYEIARSAAIRMRAVYKDRINHLTTHNARMQQILNAQPYNRRDMGFNTMMMDSLQMLHPQGPTLPHVPQRQPLEQLKSEPGGKRKVSHSASSTSSSTKKMRGGAASRWTEEQDAALKDAVAKFEGRNWKAIAELVPERDHVQCLQRWKKVLRPGLVKGHWSPEEDALLLQLIQDEKMHSWAMVASKIQGRTAKQCRERWSLNLDPGINRSPWTAEEDQLLLKLHEQMGGKWSEIKAEFNGRTENAVKTRYKSLVRAKAREWTQEQDTKLLALRMKYGKNWAAIKKELPGRSRNAIKVRCKTLEYDTNANPAM